MAEEEEIHVAGDALGAEEQGFEQDESDPGMTAFKNPIQSVEATDFDDDDDDLDGSSSISDFLAPRLSHLRVFDEDPGAEAKGEAAWRSASGKELPAVARDWLNSDRPQISQVIVSKLQASDANLTQLLNFIVRPLDGADSTDGNAALGQDALAFAAALSYLRSNASCSADSPAGVAIARNPSLFASLDQPAHRLHMYNVMLFDDAAHAACAKTAAVAAVKNGCGPMEAPPVEDSSEAGMAQSILSGNAVAVTAATTDALFAVDNVARRWASLLKSGAGGGSTEASSADAAHAPLLSLSGSTRVERSITSPTSGTSIRPVSVLFPRMGEELEALEQLAEILDAAGVSHSTPSAQAEEDARAVALGRALSGLEAPSDDMSESAKRSAGASVTPSTPTRAGAGAGMSSADDADLPTPAAVRQQADIELAAVQRSFNLTRILCGGCTLADDLVQTRAEDIAKAMFGVFSQRAKGSFYHACAVLQRLVQQQPDAVARAVASNSAQFLGNMLRYVHHAPVADTLVQVVTLNHLMSASGGAGPNASMNGGAGGPFGGGPMGMFGGGGFLSRFRSTSAKTNYEGPLPMYSSRGVAANPNSRANLWRSLGAWGFLSVFASHIYRPEYATVSEHCTTATDAFLMVLRTMATDAKAIMLLQTLPAASSGILRGLLAGACWPVAGVDYLRSGKASARGGSVGDFDDTYCRDGSVPDRQRECMRAVRAILGLVMQDVIPLPTDSTNSSPMNQMAQLPRMVENRLFRFAPVVVSVIATALPALGYALCRVHRVLHPDVNVLKGVKATHGAPASGGARPSLVAGASATSMLNALESAGSTSVAPSPDVAASGSKKKRKNRRRKRKGSSATTATPGAASDEESGEEGEEEGDDSKTTTSHTSSQAATSRARSGTLDSTRDAFSVASPVKPVASGGAPKTGGAGGGGGGGRLQFKHPGHAYAAPFGMYRLMAAQIIACVVQYDKSIPKPHAQFPVPTAGATSGSAEPSAALPSAASSGAGAGSPCVDEEDSGSEEEEEEEAGGGKAGKKGGKGGKGRRKGKGGKGSKGGKGTSAAASGKAGKPGKGGDADLERQVLGENVPTIPTVLEILTTPAACLNREQFEARAQALSTRVTAHGDVEVPPLPVFDPTEFWGTLVQWVTLYSHTNMYHIAFYAILLPVMRTAYEPALRIMLHSGKMLSAFVHHYEECAPSGVGARRMGDISAARGTILRTLNALRLSAQALPPSHFLPTHLRDHSVWATFQHRLRSDTEIILKPAMPAPPPRTPLGGVATPDNSSSFGTFSSLLSSSTYSALLGGFGQKRDEKRKADDMDWNLGSSLAKELGLEGLSPHSESSGGSSASSAVAAVARALRGGAKSSHAHDSHADIDMMGVD